MSIYISTYSNEPRDIKAAVAHSISNAMTNSIWC